MAKLFYTYLKCKPNGQPFYVGKGNERRVKNPYRRNRHYRNIINKYGKDSIKTVILFSGTEKEALEKETWFIKYFRALGCKLVNQNDGGEFPANLSKESRLAMSRAKKGKPVSPQTLAASLAARKGKKIRPCSEERKRKIALKNKGVPPAMSTRLAVSAALKGKPWPVKRREAFERSHEKNT